MRGSPAHALYSDTAAIEMPSSAIYVTLQLYLEVIAESHPPADWCVRGGQRRWVASPCQGRGVESILREGIREIQ
jgi:hypothetical protein